MAKRRKKYRRPFPNNPKLEPLKKKIPFIRSVSRKTVLAFSQLCESYELDQNDAIEEIMINFINELNQISKTENQ